MKQLDEIDSSKKTILVIEDFEHIQQLIKNVLERLDYQVFTASDGEEWLSIFNYYKDYIDLVILDIGLPKMSGKEVFEEMMKIKKDVNIIISSWLTVEEITQWLSLNPKWFLTKPFHVSEFRKLIKDIF